MRALTRHQDIYIHNYKLALRTFHQLVRAGPVGSVGEDRACTRFYRAHSMATVTGRRVLEPPPLPAPLSPTVEPSKKVAAATMRPAPLHPPPRPRAPRLAPPFPRSEQKKAGSPAINTRQQLVADSAKRHGRLLQAWRRAAEAGSPGSDARAARADLGGSRQKGAGRCVDRRRGPPAPPPPPLPHEATR